MHRYHPSCGFNVSCTGSIKLLAPEAQALLAERSEKLKQHAFGVGTEAIGIPGRHYEYVSGAKCVVLFSNMDTAVPSATLNTVSVLRNPAGKTPGQPLHEGGHLATDIRRWRFA